MPGSARTKLTFPCALALAIAASVVVASATACSKCGGSSDDAAPTTKEAELPAVPAPAKLLADVYVATPNTSWAKLQRGVGGAVGILPASAGGVVAMLAGLDPLVASEIDGTLPFYGVIAGDPASPGFLVAMRLSDVRKARAVLFDGDTARFSSRDAGGVIELVAKGQSGESPVAMGIAPSGYLLVARSSEDLVALSPYATRTLPKRTLPIDGAITFDVPRAAIGSLIEPKLRDLWTIAKSSLLAADERTRREHGGRAPDFGDPKAIVGAIDGWAAGRIAIAGDLERLRLSVDLVDDGVSVVATMTPVAGGGPAATWIHAMKIGDLAQLAALPASSAVALSVRDDDAAREEQSAGAEQLVTAALGSRLGEAETKKLHDVVADVTKARGDVLTASYVWDEPQGLALRGPVRDAESASRALRGAVELAKVSPFKELFHVKDVTTTSEDAPGLGKVQVATIRRDAPPPRAGGAAQAHDKKQVGLAWLVDGGFLSVASGETPLVTLRAAAKPEKKLGDEPAVTRTLTALGKSASAVLVVQPLRFDATRANLPAAPLVIALGRKEEDATLRIDVANGLLRELARRQLGL